MTRKVAVMHSEESMNPSYTCKECTKLVEEKKLPYSEALNKELIFKQLCFSCNFWCIRCLGVESLKSVRVNGLHYWIGNTCGGDKKFRGFGGRRFVIRFMGGREVTTTNLWHQGEIPEHFRERLPDNATFLS
jgi:hypothetical protein